MTEDRGSRCRQRGIYLKGRPVNPAEPQKGLGIGGGRYFRRSRRHPELKTKKVAGADTRNNQTLCFLNPFCMTAHPRPTPDRGLQDRAALINKGKKK